MPVQSLAGQRFVARMKNEAIEMFLSRELQEIVVVSVAGGGRGAALTGFLWLVRKGVRDRESKVAKKSRILQL